MQVIVMGPLEALKRFHALAKILTGPVRNPIKIFNK